MIDVDYFKNYNDHYGHAKGDIVLKKIAQAIKSSLHRPADIVARYGGEEFVVILPETDQDGAAAIGDKIKESISELKIEHKKSSISDYITISLGGATLSDAVDSPEKLIEIADTMLYKAKENGRDQIIWQK